MIFVIWLTSCYKINGFFFESLIIFRDYVYKNAKPLLNVDSGSFNIHLEYCLWVRISFTNYRKKSLSFIFSILMLTGVGIFKVLNNYFTLDFDWNISFES